MSTCTNNGVRKKNKTRLKIKRAVEAENESAGIECTQRY